MKESYLHLVFYAFFSLFLLASCISNSRSEIEEIESSMAQLEVLRSEAVQAIENDISSDGIEALIDLGLWVNASQALDELNQSSLTRRLGTAKLLFKQHRYEQSDSLVTEILKVEPSNIKARLLDIELDIQAWDLGSAIDKANKIILEQPRNAQVAVLLGEIALLKRDYTTALDWASKSQSWDSNFSEGYALEAEILFWNQKPDEAELVLKKALKKDPFNPDVRFSYGYAIWRRVDATQLPLMAQNWALALELNPLHYLTHWHFGNGHTHLSYVDYAQPNDEDVREELSTAEELIMEGEIDKAIENTRQIELQYPESVLPEMARGSYYYMHYDLEKSIRLDSAQAQFENILQHKSNYGPAHNGLAAVIKQRQINFLSDYEELEQRIQQTETPQDGSVFYRIFKDVDYFPGDRVTKMIAQQIGPSEVYLEMIQKFGSKFAIPPLHIDLAIAMDSKRFRYLTTFDNRQWMDIRGVGSGATGIEYIERGAHLERNVLAHEYAHLYHGRILTDDENRRIRSLYFEAMKNNRTLDYYASNNESEFFAQGYAGFLSEKKVHPLNHKSMNTREYIAQKDPDYYNFLNELLNKQIAYLNGETDLLNDNWSQTYLTLAQRSREDKNYALAKSYLDTSLNYSASYAPSQLELAEIDVMLDNSERAISTVEELKSEHENYAPVYVTESNVYNLLFIQEQITRDEALTIHRQSIQLVDENEDDLAKRASFNRLFRERLRSYSEYEQAMALARSYIETAPTISTYLRDQKELAQVFYYEVKSRLGEFNEAILFFESLVTQNPQNFEYRKIYSDILERSGETLKAIETLEIGQSILSSAGEKNYDYILGLSLLYIKSNQEKKGQEILSTMKLDEIDNLPAPKILQFIEVQIEMNEIEQARSYLDSLEVVMPELVAQKWYLDGVIHIKLGNIENAIKSFEKAIDENPYDLKAQHTLSSISI